MSDPQFTLYVSGTTPNPAKIAILLEELKLPYKIINRVGHGSVHDLKVS